MFYFVYSFLKDSNSARSSISHLSVNGNLENDNFMLVDSSTSLVTKSKYKRVFNLNEKYSI